MMHKYLENTFYGFKLWKFDFKCNSRSNRSWFVHEGELYFNWEFYPEVTEKIQYYNRTRERFTYESLLKNLVYDFLNNKDRNFIEKNKEDILKLAEDLELYRDYKVLAKL